MLYVCTSRTLWTCLLSLFIDPTNDSVFTEDILTVNIIFDYRELYIEENVTTMGWIYTTNDDQCLLRLQGYSILTANVSLLVPSYNITEINSNTTEIPSDQLTTIAGEPIYFRLIGSYENGTICSDQTTERTFYTFSGMYSMNLQSQLCRALISPSDLHKYLF